MKRILIIEDQNSLRTDIAEMLKLEGFEVHEAPDGVEGIKVAQQTQPDVIICDIMMPKLDGYGVLQQIRKESQFAFVPFIFLTAKTDRVNMRHGMVLGADDYIMKPFVVHELLDSIHTQLNRRQHLDVIINDHLERLRENIITALPHELRTPLNTILGFSEMLKLEAPALRPEQVSDWADHIHLAAQQLYRLIENYLYYVQIQVARHNPEAREEFEQAALTDAHVLADMQIEKTLQKYGRTANTVQLLPAPTLKTDQRAFMKILDEILDNASKFSPGDTPIHVTTQITPDGDYYQICIRDEGRGISPQQIQQIGAYMQFERGFYEQQGMGMGLNLVKNLIELYGGHLHVTSHKIGTQVCVQFPIVL